MFLTFATDPRTQQTKSCWRFAVTVNGRSMPRELNVAHAVSQISPASALCTANVFPQPTYAIPPLYQP